MRNKLLIGLLTLVVGFLVVTNPIVADAAGRITSAQIKNGTIRSIDVKNNNLKGKDVKDGSLTSADLAAGTVPKVRWALVNNTHTAILAQSGGISIAATAGAGTYLNFGSSVAGSSVSATNAYTDADTGFKGGIITTICGGAPYGGTCTAAGTNTNNIVWVFTQNTANTGGENHAFYVAVIG